jgi:hypothetical protein
VSSIELIADCLPENLPYFFNVPYGYFDIDVFKNLLFKAGFSEIEISVLPHVCFSRYPD